MPVTFELFVWVVGGLAGFFLVVLWFVIGRLFRLRDELVEHKMHVKDQYASKLYLQDVERRLSKELDHLADTITRFDLTVTALARTLSNIEGRLGVVPGE